MWPGANRSSAGWVLGKNCFRVQDTSSLVLGLKLLFQAKLPNWAPPSCNMETHACQQSADDVCSYSCITKDECQVTSVLSLRYRFRCEWKWITFGTFMWVSCFREISKQLFLEMASFATVLIMTQSGSNLSGHATILRFLATPAKLSINMGKFRNLSILYWL